MAYTTPRTWVNQERVLATLLNVALVDNPLALKNRPFTNVVMAAIVNTTSTSFVELTESRITLVTHGGNVLLAACGVSSNSTTGQSCTYDISIDGTRYGDATVGLTAITTPNTGYADNLSLLLRTSTPPSVGSHTWAVQWKVSANTGSVLLRFFVIEM